MLRAVVDVNVLVSGLLSRSGTPAAVIEAWRSGMFELIASPALVSELEDVIARPRLAERLGSAGQALLDVMRADAIILDDPARARVVPGDHDDDYLVALARAAGAHAIVTGDRHLLELDDPHPAVLDPRAFLALVEQVG